MEDGWDLVRSSFKHGQLATRLIGKNRTPKTTRRMVVHAWSRLRNPGSESGNKGGGYFQVALGWTRLSWGTTAFLSSLRQSSRLKT
jgi:hypothetical protein